MGDVAALTAMARANARFWPSVIPRVHRGLRRWEEAAGRIPDDRLREVALAKLAEERFNTEVAATLATLAPRRQRAQAVEAIVPLQVMYDYLDGVGELPAADPLANGRQLFGALTAALAPTGGGTPADYYSAAAKRDDGGYLPALVGAARRAFVALPSSSLVAPVACRAARRCGEAQTRTHAISVQGVEQLSEWATAEAIGSGLEWWEYAAGATASILSVHALTAAAADPRAAATEAEDLDRSYLYVAAISTLLDSVVDRRRDAEEGAHSFIAYYPDEAAIEEGVGAVVARAAAEARGTRHGAHHRMTAAGVAAYYLSAPVAADPPGPSIKARARRELGLPLAAALGVFRLWRLGKAIAGRRRRA